MRVKMRGIVGSLLFAWAVSAGAAVASTIATLTQDGATSEYADLASLVTAINTGTGNAEVVFSADATNLVLTNRLVVSNNRQVSVTAKGLITIQGRRASDQRQDGTSGIDVTNGGSLTLQYVTFANFNCWDRPFVVVDDGTVTFEAYAGLEKVVVGRRSGTTEGHEFNTFNPVYIKKGRVTLNDGAAIRDCEARETTTTSTSPSRDANGGGVYLAGEGCVLALDSGEITGCKTTHYGAGVYVEPGARVEVSGFATVADNNTVTSVRTTPNDIYVNTDDAIVVKGPLTGQKIGIYHDTAANAEVGRAFGTVKDDVTLSAEMTRTLQVFVNQRRSTEGATGSKTLVWGEAGTYMEPEAIEHPLPPKPNPTPEPIPVPCAPFAFTAIVEQEDGSWKLTLAPATVSCTYTLQTSDDLATWTTIGEPKTLQEEDAFEFTVNGGEAKRFWKVEGADGVK